jgi:nicotinate-nucleotide adenylyltransferase
VKVGVFGGTFDPPHVGHLLLASDARDALGLDRLIFVPALTQPFKAGSPPTASASDRLEMLRLAVADDAHYVVDDTEITRKGLSYTVDTLELLTTRFPGAQLFLLLGEDNMGSFDKWKNPDRIRQLATLALMERGDKSKRASTKDFEGAVVISPRRIDVSSTEIRERLRAGKSIKGFVSEGVERFIDERGLYGAPEQRARNG